MLIVVRQFSTCLAVPSVLTERILNSRKRRTTVCEWYASSDKWCETVFILMDRDEARVRSLILHRTHSSGRTKRTRIAEDLRRHWDTWSHSTWRQPESQCGACGIQQTGTMYTYFPIAGGLAWALAQSRSESASKTVTAIGLLQTHLCVRVLYVRQERRRYYEQKYCETENQHCDFFGTSIGVGLCSRLVCDLHCLLLLYIPYTCFAFSYESYTLKRALHLFRSTPLVEMKWLFSSFVVASVGVRWANTISFALSLSQQAQNG